MKLTKNGICLLLAILFFLTPLNVLAAETLKGKTETEKLDKATLNRLEDHIDKYMKSGKIPGLSVVVVKDDRDIYKNSFGYSDLKRKEKVTENTLFELGSNSKAFTALGILQLQEKGLIKLEDSINKYIPWLKLKYKGEAVDITVEQFLHHTSGIPFESIGYIKPDQKENALEDTVKTLVGSELQYYPGTEYSYATINYDVLGLLIKIVTGESYEKYMQDNIVNPYGLNNTFLFREQASEKGVIAKGYKVGFLRPLEYNAPIYRGNTPAGYFISNINDIAGWLKIQMGTSNSVHDKKLIEESHIPDRTVRPFIDGSSYAAGWSVFQSGGGELSHGGSNPNYSSFIVFRPAEKLGVAVLANLNSSYVQTLGQGIIDIILDRETAVPQDDIYLIIDNVSVTISCIAVSIILILLVLILHFIFQILKGNRKFAGSKIKCFVSTILSAVFVVGFGYCLYSIPEVLYWGLPWNFVKVWAPVTLMSAVISLFILAIMVIVFLNLNFIFKKNKKNNRPLFIMAILGVFSGFGNALIIFIINQAVNGGKEFQKGLFLYFIAGIVIYVAGQRLLRNMLVNITNEDVYSKRIMMIDRILNAPYQSIESIENGRIYAGLNNDTEVISNFANVVITGITSLVTLICCLIYLGIINIMGLIISIMVILVAAGLYFVMGRSANKYWEQTRDIQNTFFGFINDLTGGFKELYLNKLKRKQFSEDMKDKCHTYKEKRICGDMKFNNVFIIGELMFTLVIGVVVFFFPVFLNNIENTELKNYVLVFLYMTGPVHGLLSTIPNIFQVRISYSRINELIEQLPSMGTSDNEPKASGVDFSEKLNISLQGVEYSYINENSETFKVGPIDCTFKSGEIIFITGGNGSGKSTLAKLITGLYKPDNGEITLNGVKTEISELVEKFSTVFSDFYLFKRLYGVDSISKSDDIKKYLELLRLSEKVHIEDGEFDTLKLSTGQRKRLALLITYLEDRPVLLFDEWAADQDPEFKMFFYRTLLPDLKTRGKCVIAVTHDDRYFDCADRIIKMETGSIYF